MENPNYCSRMSARRSIAAVFAVSAALAVPPGAASHGRQPAAACAGPSFHELDFWLGQWTVRTRTGQPGGTSDVRSVSGGCALLEQYAGPGTYRGSGVHVFSAADRTWHQFWTDNRPAIVNDMRGRKGPTGFVYTWDVMMTPQGHPATPGDPAAVKVPKRYTLSVLEGGNVRQLGERTMDGGRTWITEFDYIYTKVK